MKKIACLLLAITLFVGCDAPQNYESTSIEDIILSNTEILENAPMGTVIGTLSAVDADSSDSHTFSIVQNRDDYDAFVLSGNELGTNTNLDYETKNIYFVTIAANDGTDSFEKQFTISILNHYDHLASEYIDYVTPGKGIKYKVTDEYQDMEADVWVVNQVIPDIESSGREYAKTIIKSGTDGGNFRNSIIMGKQTYIDGIDTFPFQSGMPVGNQAQFYRLFLIPVEIEYGSIFHWGNPGRVYTITYEGTVEVNSNTFDECIRISIEDNSEGNPYVNGAGYFIVAPDVGIIQIRYNRSVSEEAYSDTTVTYDYLEEDTFTPVSISGTVTTDGTTPAEDVYVQISAKILNKTVKTDENGAFSLPDIYGPDINLYLGYNGNDDHEDLLDFDYPEEGYPKEYVINGITGDITGVIIDLSSL